MFQSTNIKKEKEFGMHAEEMHLESVLANGDLSKMEKPDELRVVEALRERYKEGFIYTYAGPTLLSINPLRTLPLYSAEAMGTYIGKRPRECVPHLYALAEKAYRSVLSGKSHSVVLSGESGSGKTVNSNHILEFLSRRSQSEKSQLLCTRLLASAPVLEIFGNASTPNNRNSSRFGKYVEVLYDHSGKMRGARIRAFLLEKSRVTSPNGSNFHVFYAALSFFSLEQMKSDYVSRAEQKEAPEFSFASLLHHFVELGVRYTDLVGITKIILAVAHLGAIRFVEEKDSPCRSDYVRAVDSPSLEKAAELIGITEEELKFLLEIKRIRVQKEEIHKRHTMHSALISRDTLARTLYARVFNHIVSLLNHSLQGGLGGESDLGRYFQGEINTKRLLSDMERDLCDKSFSCTALPLAEMEEHLLSIGVLDIYGFEKLKDNRFDQLCINYANEKMQDDYVKMLVEREREYKSEGISLSLGARKESSLFDGRLGIVALLDEESTMPAGKDSSFVEKVCANNGCHEVFFQGGTLSVRHYAGVVEYNVEGFVSQNKNLCGEVDGVLENSGEGFLSAERGTRTSVMKEFQESLDKLREMINRNEVDYVRCLRPSESGGEFEDTYVLGQLRTSGVFETIKMFLFGFDVRMDKASFEKRYGIVEEEGVYAGKKSVFLKESLYERLEEQRGMRERVASKCIGDFLVWLLNRDTEECLFREKMKREEEELERAIKEAVSDRVEMLGEGSSGGMCVDDYLQVEVEQFLSDVGTLDDIGLEEIRSMESALSIGASDALHAETGDPDEVSRENVSHPSIDPRSSGTASMGGESEDSDREESSSNDMLLKPMGERSPACNTCSSLKERYSCQTEQMKKVLYENQLLKDHVRVFEKNLEEKNELIAELSRKIEHLFTELSNGEYSSFTTKQGREEKASFPDARRKSEVQLLYREICEVFSSLIPTPPSKIKREESLILGFFLFRGVCLSRGDSKANVEDACRAFVEHVREHFRTNRSSHILHASFFLANAHFFASICVCKAAIEMLTEIFSETCTLFTSEIKKQGMEFICKTRGLEGPEILSKIFRRPSVDSVVSYLRTIYESMRYFNLPKFVVMDLFDHIIASIDVAGFNHVVSRKKKFTYRQNIQLMHTISSFSSLLLELGIGSPYTKFNYLGSLVQLVNIQKDGLREGLVEMHRGILSNRQICDVFLALDENAKGPETEAVAEILGRRIVDEDGEGSGEKDRALEPQPSIRVEEVAEERGFDQGAFYSAISWKVKREDVVGLFKKANLKETLS
jgi:Myosin head (motor domain)